MIDFGLIKFGNIFVRIEMTLMTNSVAEMLLLCGSPVLVGSTDFNFYFKNLFIILILILAVLYKFEVSSENIKYLKARLC